MSFGSEPDIKAWADRVALNPARIPPGPRRIRRRWTTRVERLQTHVGAGLARLAQLSDSQA